MIGIHFSGSLSSYFCPRPFTHHGTHNASVTRPNQVSTAPEDLVQLSGGGVTTSASVRPFPVRRSFQLEVGSCSSFTHLGRQTAVSTRIGISTRCCGLYEAMIPEPIVCIQPMKSSIFRSVVPASPPTTSCILSTCYWLAVSQSVISYRHAICFCRLLDCCNVIFSHARAHT